MKLFNVFIVVALLGAVACSSDDGPSTSDTWVLKEQYIDPGDGSGDFIDVDSDKSIEFRPDSTVLVMGNLCSMGLDSDRMTQARYDADNIYPDCGFASVPMSYTIDGDELILSYPCVEACQEKYKRK